ncbi:MAG: hypothetical protein ABSC32_03220 [Steroidobacteraceae bacterium]|jgi:hypothetical protein
MSKLDLLFDEEEFADAFDSVEDDSRSNVRPDATVWLEGGATAAGAGMVWGHGEMHYQGSDHAFDIVGLSIAGLYTASISATGIVPYLRKLSDFSGSYSVPTNGAAVAGGGSTAYLRNERGVLIRLAVTDAGQRRNLSIIDVRVRLRRRS